MSPLTHGSNYRSACDITVKISFYRSSRLIFNYSFNIFGHIQFEYIQYLDRQKSLSGTVLRNYIDIMMQVS